MQEKPSRRSNVERSDATRSALIAAARRLFVDKSYAETGTPEIAAEAGLTRGALYHHFADKQALFEAVVEAESADVAEEIEAASSDAASPLAALQDGSRAFLDAMEKPGRTRILLLDGPAVLGRAKLDAIDARHAGRTLREGLGEAMASGALVALPLEPLAAMLGAAFDRAALMIEAGAPRADQLEVLTALIKGLRAQ
jgi:AcrR family transcriptional regulator